MCAICIAGVANQSELLSTAYALSDVDLDTIPLQMHIVNEHVGARLKYDVVAIGHGGRGISWSWRFDKRRVVDDTISHLADPAIRNRNNFRAEAQPVFVLRLGYVIGACQTTVGIESKKVDRVPLGHQSASIFHEHAAPMR